MGSIMKDIVLMRDMLSNNEVTATFHPFYSIDVFKKAGKGRGIVDRFCVWLYCLG